MSRTWCLYTWSCLDILITMHFSINCSTVICSPTVILMLSWENPLVKPMAPGSIFYHISFPIYFYLHLLFSNLYHKNTKIFILSYYLYQISPFASYHEGIDNPFIALVVRFFFVCVRVRDFWGASYWIDTLVLKNRGKYLRCFTASPFPLQGKRTLCSRGSSLSAKFRGNHVGPMLWYVMSTRTTRRRVILLLHAFSLAHARGGSQMRTCFCLLLPHAVDGHAAVDSILL